jgi:hypothetical protein
MVYTPRFDGLHTGHSETVLKKQQVADGYPQRNTPLTQEINTQLNVSASCG